MSMSINNVNNTQSTQYNRQHQQQSVGFKGAIKLQGYQHIPNVLREDVVTGPILRLTKGIKLINDFSHGMEHCTNNVYFPAGREQTENAFANRLVELGLNILHFRKPNMNWKEFDRFCKLPHPEYEP